MEGTEDFDSFYGAVFARLVGQLAVVTGDRHEAEDVVQEAMARAASRWARLGPTTLPRRGFVGWRSTWPSAGTGGLGGGWPPCYG